MNADQKFYGVVYKVKDHSPVLEDERIVFLIKDNAFAAILQDYRNKCIELGCDMDQIQAVNRMMDRVKAWRDAHPDRLKNPDAKGERLAS
jgi:hypothetical protein